MELPECYVSCHFHSGKIYFRDIVEEEKNTLSSSCIRIYQIFMCFGQLLLLQQSAIHHRIPGFPAHIPLLLATLVQHTCAQF